MTSETLSSGVIRPELTFHEYLELICILDLRAVTLCERIEYWRTTDEQRNRDFTAFDEKQLREVEAIKQKLEHAALPASTSEEKGA